MKNMRMALVMLPIAFVIGWIIRSLFTGYLKVFRTTAKFGGVDIIGERDISTAPYSSAIMFLDEVKDIWKQDAKYWYRESISTDTLTVESRTVSGDFADRNVPVQRASMVVNCTSAWELYALMISPEGFAIIDPVSPKSDHLKPPLSSYPWRKGRLEVARTVAPMPWPMANREFVVFNVIEENTLTFVSKSILYPPPGVATSNSDSATGTGTGTGTITTSMSIGKNATVRALNTFALHIEEEEEREIAGKDNTGTLFGGRRGGKRRRGSAAATQKCRISAVNYATGFFSSPALEYYINARLFFPGLKERIEKYPEI